MEQESELKEIEKENSLSDKNIESNDGSIIPGVGESNTKGSISAISISKFIDENDPVNLAFLSFLKEYNVDKSAETRKINSRSYLIICATKNEAKNLISCESKKFKLRLLSESPSEIK